MLDHLLMFATEAAAKAALPQHLDASGAWDHRVIPNQRVVLARAVRDVSNPESPVLVSPEVTVPGFFLTVQLPELSEDLRDLPGNACRTIGDRNSGENVYYAPDVNLAAMANAIVEPVPAGAKYRYL